MHCDSKSPTFNAVPITIRPRKTNPGPAGRTAKPQSKHRKARGQHRTPRRGLPPGQRFRSKESTSAGRYGAKLQAASPRSSVRYPRNERLFSFPETRITAVREVRRSPRPRSPLPGSVRSQPPRLLLPCCTAYSSSGMSIARPRAARRGRSADDRHDSVRPTSARGGQPNALPTPACSGLPERHPHQNRGLMLGSQAPGIRFPKRTVQVVDLQRIAR